MVSLCMHFSSVHSDLFVLYEHITYLVLVICNRLSMYFSASVSEYMYWQCVSLERNPSISWRMTVVCSYLNIVCELNSVELAALKIYSKCT